MIKILRKKFHTIRFGWRLNNLAYISHFHCTLGTILSWVKYRLEPSCRVLYFAARVNSVQIYSHLDHHILLLFFYMFIFKLIFFHSLESDFFLQSQKRLSTFLSNFLNSSSPIWISISYIQTNTKSSKLRDRFGFNYDRGKIHLNFKVIRAYNFFIEPSLSSVYFSLTWTFSFLFRLGLQECSIILIW